MTSHNGSGLENSGVAPLLHAQTTFPLKSLPFHWAQSRYRGEIRPCQKQHVSQNKPHYLSFEYGELRHTEIK